MVDIQTKLEIEGHRSNPYIEIFVKSHLEIIILSLLSEKSMCGYDLIKNIFAKYNVYLSQGTVYPRLYSLKDEGVLTAGYLKGNMRTKRYFLTEEGIQVTNQKLDEFNEAVNYILQSINNSKNNFHVDPGVCVLSA